jgi:hypothetical protein
MAKARRYASFTGSTPDGTGRGPSRRSSGASTVSRMHPRRQDQWRLRVHDNNTSITHVGSPREIPKGSTRDVAVSNRAPSFRELPTRRRKHKLTRRCSRINHWSKVHWFKSQIIANGIAPLQLVHQQLATRHDGKGDAGQGATQLQMVRDVVLNQKTLK